MMVTCLKLKPKLEKSQKINIYIYDLYSETKNRKK